MIVGTRGETPEYFAEAEHFMRELPVSQFHVFSYSERPGTKALEIPYVVAEEEKHRRSNALLALSDEKLHAFYENYRGTDRPVLLEHSKTPGVMHGFTDNYVKVELHIDNSLIEQLDNTIVRVHLGDWNEKGDALLAEIV